MSFGKASAAAAACMTLVAGPAGAAEATSALAWSTYLRAGPSETSAALDELAHDVTVRVLGCDARWCHVADGTVQGYVDRDALALPRVPPPDASALGHCTIAALSDAPNGAPTRLCDSGRR